jgi:hypothetical protein
MRTLAQSEPAGNARAIAEISMRLRWKFISDNSSVRSNSFSKIFDTLRIQRQQLKRNIPNGAVPNQDFVVP